MNMQAIHRFRTNLSGLMKHRHVGQRQLGRLAGTSASMINRVLHGKAEDFTVCWGTQIADAFGLNFWDLFLDPVSFEKKFLSKKPHAA